MLRSSDGAFIDEVELDSPKLEHALAPLILSLATDEKALALIFKDSTSLTLINVDGFIEQLTRLNPRATILYLSAQTLLHAVMDCETIVATHAEIALDMLKTRDLINYYDIFWHLLNCGYELSLIDLFKEIPEVFADISLSLIEDDTVKLYRRHLNLFNLFAMQLPAFAKQLAGDVAFIDSIGLPNIIKNTPHLTWMLITDRMLGVDYRAFILLLQQGYEGRVVDSLNKVSELRRCLLAKLTPKDLITIYQHYPLLFNYLAIDNHDIFLKSTHLNKAAYFMALAINILTTVANKVNPSFATLSTMVNRSLTIPSQYWQEIANRAPIVLVKCLKAYFTREYLILEKRICTREQLPLWKKCDTWPIFMIILQHDFVLGLQLINDKAYRYNLRQAEAGLLSLHIKTYLNTVESVEGKREPEELNDAPAKISEINLMLSLHQLLQKCNWLVQFELINHLAELEAFKHVLERWFLVEPEWRASFLEELYKLKNYGTYHPHLLRIIPREWQPDLQEFEEVKKLLMYSSQPQVLARTSEPEIIANSSRFMPIPASKTSSQPSSQAASAPSSWNWLPWGSN